MASKASILVGFLRGGGKWGTLRIPRRRLGEPDKTIGKFGANLCGPSKIEPEEVMA